jgi:hypothetical protein
MAYARMKDGQLDNDATLDQVDEICKRDIPLKECIEQLRELLEDAMTIANSEGYNDGLADGQKQEGAN